MYLIQVSLLLAVLSLPQGLEKKYRTKRCEKWTEKFELCLAIGYQPRHYKACQEDVVMGELERKKSCRRMEIRIKKKCNFTCTPLVGAPQEISVEAKEAVRAAEVAVAELRDRAVQHNTLDKGSTFIRGKIVKAVKQVVSGQKLVITMKLGVTDNFECKMLARERIVSSSDCSDEDNMGTYQITIVYAPWRDPEFEFGEFVDIDGPGMKETYWEQTSEEIA